ncbi:MAG: hypothetical protein JNL11_02595 [Bdellovibrionaceae bacterium]|nr:hypothetical protein [Pseudobdellovibrionaceae bacterium]
MKIIAMVLFFSLAVWSDELRLDYQYISSSLMLSKKVFTEDGEMNMGYFVTCRDEDGDVCQSTCGQNSCLIARDSCDSCVSSSNLNIFAIFRDFSNLFSLRQNPIDWGLVFSELKSGSWRILDENTILNLFEDTQADEKYSDAKNRFMSRCPVMTASAYLLVNARNLRPYIYVCQGPYGIVTYDTHGVLESIP